MRDPQGVSEKFNFEKYMNARKVARRIALLLASHIDVGMSEDEGHEIIEELMKKNGVEKKWHPTKFRIGKNTLKSFREKSEPDVKVQEEDIFFLDIGPVIENQEADFGQTFTVGQNPEYSKIQRATKKVFDQTAALWKAEKLTGQALYDKAEEFAKAEGYVLNDKMAGHRLGDFPHALYNKGSLKNFEETPKENLWVLEIHLRHPEKEFGAFFEDILIND